MKKEVKEIIDFYYNSPVFSKENILYNFLAAYFHQDSDFDDRVVVKEYINESNRQQIRLLYDAIDDLIRTDKFSEKNKREYIADITSYTTLPENALEWLLKIKELLIEYKKDDNK